VLNNLPFAVGAAIRFGDVRLPVFLDPALADEVVLTAVPKVHWIDLGRGVGTSVTEPGHVRVTTTGGVVHEHQSDIPLGNPSRPMTMGQLRRKFIDCAACAARPIDPSHAATIADAVMCLETASNIETLMSLLT
jgi:hypothetical protein